MKIYTKGGDKGETSLFSGERVSKTDYRVEAYGTMDELSSILGVVVASLSEGVDGLLLELTEIQRVLFRACSWVATSSDSENSNYLEEVTAENLQHLEGSIDRMVEVLPEIKGFIIPGGTQPAAWTHVARTVCRRAERELLKINMDTITGKSEEQIQLVRRYLNRLSDYLFTLARLINHQSGSADVLLK